MQKLYSAKKVESEVQEYWNTNNTFQVHEDIHKQKYYCLSMLPYPSGYLHMGHVRNYTIGDVISRYQRMLGKNVLQPIGWDAFGLPAERAAIIHKTQPATWTYKNICYMKKQLKMLGFSYDWSREIITCQPKYYKWEQWFFTILYNKGLVYKKTSKVNWCPHDNTVLANEQVINGCCWRCNTNIEYKYIPQWFIKITDYADQLFYGLDKLNGWPEQIKTMQKNWIGRSSGIEVDFKILENNKILKIFITQIDNFMYATYVAINFNHPLSLEISKTQPKLLEFIQKYNTNKIININSVDIELQGISTDMHIVHPITNNKLPIWITNDYTDDDYLNAILGAPSCNESDLNFARKYNLSTNIIFLACDHINKFDYYLFNQQELFNIFKNQKMHEKKKFKIISKLLIKYGVAKPKIKYKLRDWNVSRQRYWGTPIPIITINHNNIVIPMSINELPVCLPEYDINKGSSINPLKEDKNWINIIYNGQPAVRETDTFDTFIESSWYYARYTCPNYDKGMLDSKAVNYWLPIDQYVGGIEHATMHLLYFRFYHKLMRDIGLVNSDEPAQRIICQGMVLSDAFYSLEKNGEKKWISPNNVIIKYDINGNIATVCDITGKKLVHAGMNKMSKSKNNGVDPQKIIEKYGADTVRLFIMFAAPVNMPLEWKESGIMGAHRFLKRIWKMTYEHIQHQELCVLDVQTLNIEQKNFLRDMHITILKVTNDIDKRQMFNTAISSIMKLVNKLVKISKKSQQDLALMQEGLSVILRLLYPFTPHISFILWKALGKQDDIDHTPWPIANTKIITDDTSNIIIQVNGKFRCMLTVPSKSDQNFVYKCALQNTMVNKYIKENTVLRIIYIKNKLLNLVLD